MLALEALDGAAGDLLDLAVGVALAAGAGDDDEGAEGGDIGQGGLQGGEEGRGRAGRRRNDAGAALCGEALAGLQH